MNMRSLRTDSIVHRPPRFHVWVVLSSTVLGIVGFAASLAASSSPWWMLGFGAWVAAGGLALVELRTTRVELGPEGLTFVRRFRRHFVSRRRIESVTWGKGVGVSLRLVDGEWIGLPEVGPSSQGLANSIRAWLRRTETGASRA